MRAATACAFSASYENVDGISDATTRAVYSSSGTFCVLPSFMRTMTFDEDRDVRYSSGMGDVWSGGVVVIIFMFDDGVAAGAAGASAAAFFTAGSAALSVVIMVWGGADAARVSPEASAALLPFIAYITVTVIKTIRAGMSRAPGALFLFLMLIYFICAGTSFLLCVTFYRYASYEKYICTHRRTYACII